MGADRDHTAYDIRFPSAEVSTGTPGPGFGSALDLFLYSLGALAVPASGRSDRARLCTSGSALPSIAVKFATIQESQRSLSWRAFIDRHRAHDTSITMASSN
jgi:hypothetical protein